MIPPASLHPGRRYRAPSLLPSPPLAPSRRRIRDGHANGVYVGAGCAGKLIGCSVVGNAEAGITIAEGGDPLLVDCK